MSETLTHQWYLRDIADGLRADGQPVLAEKLEAAAAEIDRLERDVDRLKREVRDWECWLGGVLV